MITMKSPRVSVAMPVYNCEKYVAKAVESIPAQTFKDFEFLIVDDGSTDASRAILQEYVALLSDFERQLQCLDDHPECVLLGSRVMIIDPDGDPLREMGDALTHEEIGDALMNAMGQIVYHPSVMFRRQVVLDLGGYRPEYYLTYKRRGKAAPAGTLERFNRTRRGGLSKQLPRPTWS